MDLPEISSIAASVVPSRDPEIKLHTSLARAKSALQVVTRSNAFNQYVFEEHNTKPDTGEVYAIRDGEWCLAYHVLGSGIIEDLQYALTDASAIRMGMPPMGYTVYESGLRRVYRLPAVKVEPSVSYR